MSAVADESAGTPFPVKRLARIEVPPEAEAEWLIDDLWGARAVGCLGGLPKSAKTWIALEMALAVASGRPCFGRYRVHHQGPVLVHCAEDGAAQVKRRVAGLCHVRGVDFDRLALGWVDAGSLQLDRPGDQLRLAATVEQTKARMLVLDPLVRLHRGDENSSADMSRLLGFLRSLQQEFGVAIVLVHHARKSAVSEAGQALRGSGDLHAWGDSNLYVVRRDDKRLLAPEHRSRPTPQPVTFTLEGDPPRLVVGGPVPPSDPLEQRIVTALSREPMTRGALRDALGIRNETLGDVLQRLEQQGKLIRVEGRLAVPVPAHADRRERQTPPTPTR
jgi:hypothetical protein